MKKTIMIAALTAIVFGGAGFYGGMQYARGDSDAAEDLINDGTTLLRSSDHDGLVLYIYTGPGWF